MAFLAAVAPYLAAAGTVVAVAGQVQAANAARAAAQAQQVEKDFEAAQLNQQAGQVEAAAQRTAAEQERQAKLTASRILAIASSSGAGASDPTVTDLLGRNAATGAYNSSMALYQGESQARQLRLSASGASYTGDVLAAGGLNTQAAYNTKALGSGLSGVSLFTKYGAGGPTSYSTAAGISGGTSDAGTPASSPFG